LQACQSIHESLLNFDIHLSQDVGYAFAGLALSIYLAGRVATVLDLLENGFFDFSVAISYVDTIIGTLPKRLAGSYIHRGNPKK
jgi:hypothetical protein